MRIMLIDDDAVVRDNLKTLLSIYAPDSEIAGEADGVQSGLKLLASDTPDVLLLDVEMKDGTGFDLLSIYGKLDFKVIFVTGHDGYAIRAFKFSAVDYILKPVDADLLVAALKRAEETLNKSEQQLTISTLVENKQTNNAEQKIILRDAESVYLISICDVIRCASEANYTRFFLTDGRQLLISKTLKEYDSLFQDHSFFRAHQSHLINLLHFDRYEKKDGGIVHMKDQSTLPVAVRKKESLLKALESIE